MPLVTTTDTVEVQALCAGVVAGDPVAGTIFATIADWAVRDGASGWAAHPPDRPTVLVARSHGDTPVTLTPGWRPDDVTDLAEALSGLVPSPASLAGPTDLVDALVRADDRPVTERTAERLYRLDDLVPPVGVAGRARLAEEHDVDQLAQWFYEFQMEALGRVAPGQRTAEMVRHGISTGRCWLWLDDDDKTRAFAQRRPVIDGVSRIGPVFTPREHRGRGYGSAATSAATRDILDEGAIPCLYTDLANPASNRVYQSLGYYPVLDRALVRFD